MQSANLCDAIEADPLRVANRLNACRLIAPSIKKDIKSMSGTAYDKADAIVEELQRQIDADSNPVEFLRKISSFLKKQTDKTLKEIGDEIMNQLSQ